METNILIPFLLTLFAGLSTGIGSIIAFFTTKTNKKFLSYSLGLSAGVMIYISFVELFASSKEILIMEFGEKLGMIQNITFFFAGVLLIGIIDKLVPSSENP
ncbi:MAG: zinc transporter ZupT, partial [Bacilli bacterium]|nr:zinc transporter ZupT [Bacilli bacterium]